MAVDSPEYIDSALKVYNVEVHRAIKAQQQRLAQLKDAYDQLQDTITTVAELPAKLRHQLMVPLGRHAFFPGHLARTNEILVHLGDQYYVETSAVAAESILQRRLAVLADGVGKAQQQLQALQARLEVTHSSLMDERSGEGAFEIRSSVEESDALLATASKHRRSGQAADAAARANHQQQGTVNRVTAGYSYTPLGTPQVQNHQQPDPADAALQARLEELIRLEEQQEAAEQAEFWGQQKQQLAPIQEDEEETEDGVGHATATAAPPAASDRTASSTAVQHLQQLEQQADSDDEDDHQQQPLHSALAASPGASCSTATPSIAGKASGSGLKSALKKGFLTSSSKPRASSSRTTTANRTTSGSSTSSASAAISSRSQSNKAFTGAVVEREAPDIVEKGFVAPSAIDAVLERPVAPSAAASRGSNSTAGSRPSVFKLRRMHTESEGQ